MWIIFLRYFCHGNSIHFAHNDCNMSRQIKFIWVLSLFSVLFLIGMQGYWLYNQYEYVLNAYSEEIALQALQAGEEEYRNRKDEISMKIPSTFIIHKVNRAENSNEADSTNFKFQLKIGSLAVNSMSTNDSLSTLNEQHYYTNLKEFEWRDAAERVMVNQSKPFDAAQFDSILAAMLPELEYAIAFWQEDDIYDGSGLWNRTGNLFHPRLIVSYAYSPLENKGIFVNINLPAQPVLYRMGIQLVVSAGLTFLLIVCLIFQVRTIIRQKKINEIRENFVNTMVHELKRPVQTLKTFVSFLKDEKMRSDAEAAEQVVRDSMFELDNLSAYLNKLKDMLLADSETTSLHITTFNLQDLVEKVIRLTHIPPEKKAIITPVYETDHLLVEADPIHFANVLSNLIENAIKYSGEKVCIEIKVGHDKRKIWVSVSDDGIGIPVAEQDSVFTKFYRGNNIPDKTIPGIGLGLSYVKFIIEAHQGSIKLNSQAGEGTAVTIYLPQ